jgi:hypothetical protein
MKVLIYMLIALTGLSFSVPSFQRIWKGSFVVRPIFSVNSVHLIVFSPLEILIHIKIDILALMSGLLCSIKIS